MHSEKESMWKTNLNILKFQWILVTSIIFVQSQHERLTSSDDSITGFFLERDLSPTLPKHGKLNVKIILNASLNNIVN